MNPSVLRLACRIVAASSKAKPADAVLRAALKQQSGLLRLEGAAVSDAVFAYFRWFGWLDPAHPVPQNLERATQLNAAFQNHPESITGAELTARAVPAWVQSECEISERWCRVLQMRPRLWLRARPGQGKALAAKLGEARALTAPLPEEVVEYSGLQDLLRLPEFHHGDFEIQDLSSQVVALVCAPSPGETWWDACAGQGGKTLHLSDLMRNTGLIWATDRAAWRLKVLARRAARARVFNYRSRTWEGSAILPTKTRFDGVLLDAPCSGLGTWHRNPHARWTTTPDDVRDLSRVQLELLSRVAPSVKPGGKLVYAVCTATRRETDEVAEAFERALPEFERIGIRSPLLPRALERPRLKLAVEEFGGNGMFVAAWRRAA
jgi:16S rRNA (cytosine967-C5)-methyltransferase